MTATGYTLDEADAMPFPKVVELFRYWLECPPAHLLLKGFVGYKGSRKELNEHERAALPPPNAQLPPPPAYVIDAMRRYKAERSHA